MSGQALAGWTLAELDEEEARRVQDDDLDPDELLTLQRLLERFGKNQADLHYAIRRSALGLAQEARAAREREWPGNPRSSS